MDRFEIVTWLVRAIGVYAALGVVFAGAFVVRGVERLDRGAHGSGLGFRLILFPGSVAFWPLLLARWVRGTGQPVEANAHRRAAQVKEGARR